MTVQLATSMTLKVGFISPWLATITYLESGDWTRLSGRSLSVMCLPAGDSRHPVGSRMEPSGKVPGTAVGSGANCARIVGTAAATTSEAMATRASKRAREIKTRRNQSAGA